MKNIRKLIVLVLMLSTILGLAACGSTDVSGEEDAKFVVESNINAIYLGDADSEYLERTGTSNVDAAKDYLAGIELEAEYFAYYWGIIDADYDEQYSDLDQSLRQEISDLYKEIYDHTKYEIESVAKLDDSTYTVKVLVDPIDIMNQAYTIYQSGEYAPLNEFYAKYENVDFNTITDEEYNAYTNEYGKIIVQLVKEQLPNLGYMEQKSLAIQVEEVDNVTGINEDDWSVFDTYVIYYP